LRFVRREKEGTIKSERSERRGKEDTFGGLRQQLEVDNTFGVLAHGRADAVIARVATADHQHALVCGVDALTIPAKERTNVKAREYRQKTSDD